MAETIKQTAGREQLGNFAPQFARINDDVLFGEVWNEKAIDLKTKCLVTVVALMSSGITDSSLRYHLQNAKSNGVTREEIAAVITHAAMYAGIPKGWAAFRLAKDIWKNDAAVSFEEIFASEDSKVRDMSELASAIIKDYYDPLLGEEQNDYMIEMFQSYTSIKNQLAAGKRYFFVKENGRARVHDMADPILVGTGIKYIHKFDPTQVFTILYFEGGNFNYMVKRFNLEGCPMTTEFNLISDHKDSQMIEFFATDDARQLMEYQVGREVQKEELDLTEVADIKSYKALGSKFTAKKVKRTSRISPADTFDDGTDDSATGTEVSVKDEDDNDLFK